MASGGPGVGKGLANDNEGCGEWERAGVDVENVDLVTEIFLRARDTDKSNSDDLMDDFRLRSECLDRNNKHTIWRL